IAGVVNIRLKRDFEGLELDAQYGITDRSDGESANLTLTGGGAYANGRGNFLAALGYFDREFVPQGARPFFARSGVASSLQGGLVIADPTNLPDQAVLNDVFI